MERAGISDGSTDSADRSDTTPHLQRRASKASGEMAQVRRAAPCPLPALCPPAAGPAAPQQRVPNAVLPHGGLALLGVSQDSRRSHCGAPAPSLARPSPPPAPQANHLAAQLGLHSALAPPSPPVQQSLTELQVGAAGARQPLG